MQIDLAAMARRAGVYRRPTFTARAINPPDAQRSDLLKIYMRAVRGWLAAWTETIEPLYKSTVAPGVRDSVASVGGGVGEAEAALSRLVIALGADLQDWTISVEKWHRGQVGRIFTPVGVRLDLLLGPGDVSPTLQAVLGDNVSLIRSLNDQMRNGISGAVFRGLTNRTPPRDVAREIRAQAEIGKKRAELIAADQSQKLTSRLDQARQEQLGLTRFEWAHSGKLHPREYHKARDGKVYRWDSPIGKTDPPGFAIRCGCRSRAVLDLDDEIETPEPAAPPPPPPDVPKLDAAARDYVTRNGKRDGIEYLSAFDAKTGKSYGTNKGTRGSSALTPEMIAALDDPTAKLIFHHNHPSSSSLSRADIDFTQRKGVRQIVAHGHNGSSFYAAAGKLRLAEWAYVAARRHVYDRLNAAVQARALSIPDAELLHQHLVMLALHRARRIKYDFRLSGSSAKAFDTQPDFFLAIVESAPL